MDEAAPSVAIYHITWTRTRDGKPKLKMFVTDQQGFRVPHPVLLDLPIPAYFYAKREVVEAKGIPPGAKAELVNVMLGMQGREALVYKVTVTEPSEVTGLRGFYGVQNTYEADVPYGRRVMIDRDLTVAMPSKRLYIDLECDGREGVPDEVEASKRIISIAAVDQDGAEWFFSDEDEVKMIADFLILLDRYPIVCTWYGNRFDWPYLTNRCQKLDIRFYWDSIIHIDLLVVLRDVMQEKRDQNGLDFIADHEELRHRKANVSIAELYPSFEGDKVKLRDRNVQDAQIIRDLDLKYNMVPIMFDVAKATHTTVRDLLRVNEKNNKDWNPSVAVDGLNLTLSGRRTPPVVWPSKEYKEATDDEEEQFTGAWVIDPVPGLHKNVVIFDVKSLYPSLIRTGNVGPETYRPDGSGDIKAPHGSFVSEPESVMAEGIRSITELRERYRREKNACVPDSNEYKAAYAKEYAMKVVNNSVYGVSGSRHSRYFYKDVAENVTLMGQAVTKFMQAELEALGYPVIYGDTDSCMAVLGDEEDVVGTAKFLVNYLTERGRQFLEESFTPKKAMFALDISCICQTMYILRKQGKVAGKGTKKRYAGIVIWNKERVFYLLKKGLEMVRHDSTKAQKEVQEDAIWRKLLEESPDEEMAAANEWKRRLFTGELNAKLVTWKGFGKHFDEYKTTTPAMRAAKMMMESGAISRILKGDKVCYIKTGPKPEQIKPVAEGEVPVLTDAELGYIWDAQFKRIYDRLEVPVSDERARYKAIRLRKDGKPYGFKAPATDEAPKPKKKSIVNELVERAEKEKVFVAQLEDADLDYAKGVMTTQAGPVPWFAYDSYSHNSDAFTQEEFEQTTLYSHALGHYIRRMLGMTQKPVEDFKADLPGDCEIGVVSEKWYSSGSPYLVERPSGTFRPTLSGFIVPEADKRVELRFLITPDMARSVRIVKSWPKPSGVTRHFIASESAVKAGADKDVWVRLKAVVGSP